MIFPERKDLRSCMLCNSIIDGDQKLYLITDKGACSINEASLQGGR